MNDTVRTEHPAGAAKRILGEFDVDREATVHLTSGRSFYGKVSTTETTGLLRVSGGHATVVVCAAHIAAVEQGGQR